VNIHLFEQPVFYYLFIDNLYLVCNDL